MQSLSDRLAAAIGDEHISTGISVQGLVKTTADEWQVRASSGETWTADGAVIALPAYGAASVLGGVDNDLAYELNLIPYASTATINIAFRREDVKHPLNGFGFVVPFVEHRKILACTFSSVKFAGRAPDGAVLLRAFAGGALQPEVFSLPKDELISIVASELKELLGISGKHLFAHVEKWPRSMAQYHVGHMDRVGRIKNRVESHRGLELAGNAYCGAGIPDCIRSGEFAAETVVRQVVAGAGGRGPGVGESAYRPGNESGGC